VERGRNGAPVAFRVWRAGANPTDKGTHYFTKQSAARLMSEQSDRGTLYAIDVDHLSLDSKAPPESRRAVGWHRLAVRDGKDGPELWATNVAWTKSVLAGLLANPPEWRYFSPAYDVDKTSGEIIGYLNCALTNNPATWDVTALAGRQLSRHTRRTEESIRAGLRVLEEAHGKEFAVEMAKLAARAR
jgi:phage I-like protein